MKRDVISSSDEDLSKASSPERKKLKEEPGMDSSSLVPGNNLSKSEPPIMDSKLPGKAEDGDQKKASSLPAPPKPLEKAVAAAVTAASATATAASATTAERSALGGAYPNPSNFAERLMHVLDNEIAKESLWWLGNGEAIAVHPEKIKESPVLASHFQGNRYTSFIRNLNRWGFRRVSYYTLPETVVGFHNSLFRRDKPQLVKYMEVDSEVQEIFARHQMENEGKNSAELEAAAKAAAKVASQSAGDGAEDTPTERQQDAMRQLLSQQASPTTNNAKKEGAASSSHPQLSNTTLQNQVQPSSEPNHLQAQMSALLRDRLAQQQQQQQQQQQNPMQSLLGGLSNVDSSNVAALAALTNHQSTLPASLGGSGSDGSGPLLQRLLDLSQQYLDASSGDGGPSVVSIRTLLELLNVLGRKELLYQREQEDQRNAQSATIQRLLMQIRQTSGRQAPQQQQPPTPQQQLAALQQGNQGSNLMQQMLLQQRLGGQQQYPHQQQDTGNGNLLQQLLQRVGQGPLDHNQSMQQLGQQQQQQQEQQSQPGEAGSGAPDVSQLLQLLRQQQQNNNNNNNPS